MEAHRVTWAGLAYYRDSLRAGRSGDRILVLGDVSCPSRPWILPNLLYSGHRVILGDKAAGEWR